jgi:hypothetical protein
MVSSVASVLVATVLIGSVPGRITPDPVDNVAE